MFVIHNRSAVIVDCTMMTPESFHFSATPVSSHLSATPASSHLSATPAFSPTHHIVVIHGVDPRGSMPVIHNLSAVIVDCTMAAAAMLHRGFFISEKIISRHRLFFLGVKLVVTGLRSLRRIAICASKMCSLKFGRLGLFLFFFFELLFVCLRFSISNRFALFCRSFSCCSTW